MKNAETGGAVFNSPAQLLLLHQGEEEDAARAKALLPKERILPSGEVSWNFCFDYGKNIL